jgi:hypothetical protein
MNKYGANVCVTQKLLICEEDNHPAASWIEKPVIKLKS